MHLDQFAPISRSSFSSSPEGSKKSSLASTFSDATTRSSLSSERNRISQLLWSPSPEPQPTLDKTASLLLSSGISTPTLAGLRDETSTREEFEKDEEDFPSVANDPSPVLTCSSNPELDEEELGSTSSPDPVTESLASDFPGEAGISFSRAEDSDQKATFPTTKNPFSTEEQKSHRGVETSS